MPFEWTRDDARKQIVAVGEGEFRAGDIVQLIAGLRESGAWTYAMLMDLRHMKAQGGVPGLKQIRELSMPVAGGADNRGPLAILATDSMYAAACAYAALAKPAGRVRVFRERAEAEQWLASSQE